MLLLERFTLAGVHTERGLPLAHRRLVSVSCFKKKKKAKSSLRLDSRLVLEGRAAESEPRPRLSPWRVISHLALCHSDIFVSD